MPSPSPSTPKTVKRPRQVDSQLVTNVVIKACSMHMILKGALTSMQRRDAAHILRRRVVADAFQLDHAACKHSKR